MKITIAERFHPFSHRLGTKFLLPKSTLAVQVYPTRLQFTDLEKRLPAFFVDFSLKGPVKEFTAELDLELGLLKVFGRAQDGFIRYLMQATSDGVLLTMEKIPGEKIECRHSLSPHPFVLSKGERLLIPFSLEESEVAIEGERLSLGMHKAQEWDSICRRFDFKEIFPLWHRLCAWMPPSKAITTSEGNYSLLEECRKKIDRNEKDDVLAAFEKFFLAAFEGVMTPRLLDTEYQGILKVENKHEEMSPLPLLTEGGKLIRSLFFRETSKELEILPCLPAQFHCGRMTGLKTSQGHTLDFEWTKKQLRRLRLVSSFSGEVFLKLPKGIGVCRVRIGRKTVKRPAIDPEGKMRCELKANEVLHLDRFSK